jgi:hypothetical protein
MQEEDTEDSAGVCWGKLVELIKSSAKIFVLACIYAIMNLLSFVALQYIGMSLTFPVHAFTINPNFVRLYQ